MRPSRLVVPDARGQGASLRVSRHTDQGKVVLSHWRDDVCVASTPIELREVPALIGVLADALGEAIDGDLPVVEGAGRLGVVGRVRAWLRPRLAQISELRRPPLGGSPGEPGEGGEGQEQAV